ncbi:type II toxin-antitoxin system PemK/MazF family toxin [Methylotuvimicrobium buryatense]|uniref:type II toxin-antitoxin system PemK/MazF family toxin n=1 Tax=Methylotuvimicrobium buryatense TaxID=95641 RepID=UPI00034748F9|nr:type II toxin-antitoxin system PemK/MazF family toxin [Methylotuvimicrobium buryatense]
MTSPIVTYSCYDIVKVPFPFTDRQSSKNRPALVLSVDKTFNSPIGHSVMSMITSAKHSGWPLDTQIENLMAAGLPSPFIIRLKLFTLDNRLILAKLGQFASADQIAVEQRLKTLFCLS